MISIRRIPGYQGRQVVVVETIYHPGVAVDSHPPEFVPIGGIVLDEKTHPWIGLDIGQSGETRAPFRFLIDGGDHHPIDHCKDDRDLLRPPAGIDGREDRHRGGNEPGPGLGFAQRRQDAIPSTSCRSPGSGPSPGVTGEAPALGLTNHVGLFTVGMKAVRPTPSKWAGRGPAHLARLLNPPVG